MARSKAAMVAAVVLVGLAAAVGVALAQQADQGGGRGGRGGWDPAQMRQQMEARMKEMLGASDEDWAVISPRLEAVQTLQRDARGGGMMGMFGRGFGALGGRGGFPVPGGPGAPGAAGPQGGAEEEQSEVQKASQNLSTLLENTSSTPEQVKAALTAYRAAREKSRQELAKAQDSLREVLSLRQEAQLVLMGTLD